MRLLRVTPLAFALLILLPAAAPAQPAGASLVELPKLVRPDQFIMVVTPAGEEILGSLITATADSLTIRVLTHVKRQDGALETSSKGERTIQAADVAVIDRLDTPGGPRTTIYRTPSSFGAFRDRLRIGDTVEVWETTTRTKGRVAELTPSSLVLLTNDTKPGGTGRRTFQAATVTEIKRTGPIWDGAVKGAAVGALILTIVHGWDHGNGPIVLVGGLSTAIGFGIDVAFGPRTVYRPTQQTRRVTFAPIIGSGGHGIRAQIRF